MKRHHPVAAVAAGAIATLAAVLIVGCASPSTGTPERAGTASAVTTSPLSVASSVASAVVPTSQDVETTPTESTSGQAPATAEAVEDPLAGRAQVVADDYLWDERQWAFTSPDGRWACLIHDPDLRVDYVTGGFRCDSRSLSDNPAAEFPALESDVDTAGWCREGARILPGVITAGNDFRPPYGICQDQFAPLFQDAEHMPLELPTGAVLSVDSRTCWIGLSDADVGDDVQLPRRPSESQSIDTVTCVDSSNSSGFSLWSDGYVAYSSES